METMNMIAGAKQIMLAVALLWATPASSFSFGPGGCFASRPSIASIHLRQMKLITGTLQEGNLSVLLNGKELSTTKTNRFTPNEMHTLTLTTTSSDGYFRGFLFRLGNPDDITDPDALDVPGDAATSLNMTAAETLPSATRLILPIDFANTQLAASCMLHNASGIGHTNSSKKTTVSGILHLDHARSGMRLDVTVVVKNRNHVSEFYYSGYDMHAETKAQEVISVILLGVAFIGVAVVGIFAVRFIINRSKQQRKANYELASVKDADGDNENPMDDSDEDDRMT